VETVSQMEIAHHTAPQFGIRDGSVTEYPRTLTKRESRSLLGGWRYNGACVVQLDHNLYWLPKQCLKWSYRP
jgi:hypothetical protein